MIVKIFTALLLCFLSLMYIPSEVKAEGNNSDLVGTLCVAAEILAGGASAYTLGFIVPYELSCAGVTVCSADPYNDGKLQFIGKLAVDYTAMAVGSTIGAYLVGIIGNEKGTLSEEMTSFAWTLGNSSLGGLLALIISSLVGYDPVNKGGEEPGIGYCCFVVTPGLVFTTAGAVIGFNKSRDHIISKEFLFRYQRFRKSRTTVRYSPRPCEDEILANLER